MEHLEIELKFYVSDFESLRARLTNLGAVRTGQPALEHNIRYETEDDRLLENKCLLRLRKDRQTTLTFKLPPPEKDDRFKVYRELEVSVSDFETMDAILNAPPGFEMLSAEMQKKLKRVRGKHLYPEIVVQLEAMQEMNAFIVKMFTTVRAELDKLRRKYLPIHIVKKSA